MSILLTELSTDAILKPDIRLVFFDIDGTLLDKNGGYPAGLKSAIARIQKQGILTAIASGRPHFAAQFIMDDLALNAPGVFCTGAHIYSPSKQQTLVAHTLAPTIAQTLIEAIRRLGIYYELYTDSAFYIEQDIASDIRNVHAQHLRRQPQLQHFDALVAAQPIYKLLIGADQTKDSESLQQLEAQFPDLIFAYAGLPGFPQWRFASIIDKRADKLLAFQWLLDHHGIKAENVMSFGDAQSDMVFLQAAGTGIAMGNATEEVKAVAKFVTKPVWDDGIAFALEKLIPIE